MLRLDRYNYSSKNKCLLFIFFFFSTGTLFSKKTVPKNVLIEIDKADDDKKIEKTKASEQKIKNVTKNNIIKKKGIYSKKIKSNKQMNKDINYYNNSISMIQNEINEIKKKFKKFDKLQDTEHNIKNIKNMNILLEVHTESDILVKKLYFYINKHLLFEQSNIGNSKIKDPIAVYNGPLLQDNNQFSLKLLVSAISSNKSIYYKSIQKEIMIDLKNYKGKDLSLFSSVEESEENITLSLNKNK